MAKIKEAKLSDIIPDDLNANKGTEYGKHLMNQSFEKFGTWRSIAVDKNLKVAAGNKSLENFAEAGFEDVIIVPTNGKQLVVVQRTDIDSTTPEGEKMFREYGLADNATSNANLEWNEENIRAISEKWDINPEEWGIDTAFEDEEEQNECDDKEIVSTKMEVECGDASKLAELFGELQERGFKVKFV